MSGQVNPRDVPSILRDLSRRVSTLERLPRKQNDREGYFELVLEFTDGLYVGQETGRYPVARSFTVVGWRSTADTAGSTSTSIQIRKNASTAKTLTIAASTQFTATATIGIGYGAGDYLQGNCSVAGTGIEDVVVILECIEHR